MTKMLLSLLMALSALSAELRSAQVAGSAAAVPAASSTAIMRVTHPYSFDPRPFSDTNVLVRGALVNIFCLPTAGAVSPVSGSGVIIDPRGIILTNAHVAQYVLLSEDPRVNLRCVVRSGSPARDMWKAQVLYMPPVWVEKHADEINTQHPQGTGEHDYALLNIFDTVSGAPLPGSFPFVEYDARENMAFPGDSVLVAGYPAEFSSDMATVQSLYAASSVTTVSKLLTFRADTVDAFSVGSVIAAQSGSSGGAVVNAWGRLVGVITTMSSGATTADRDLRAVAISYIQRDMQAQTGKTLDTFLAQDIDTAQDTFNTTQAPSLIMRLESTLSK